jgi:hypothetical protein
VLLSAVQLLFHGGPLFDHPHHGVTIGVRGILRQVVRMYPSLQRVYEQVSSQPPMSP